MARQRTILLTGASGVVGSALLPALRRHRVICLTHRKAVKHPYQVKGDVAVPDLGLDPGTFARLCREVNVVVHCAAVTDFTADPELTLRSNVEGTRNVTRFAGDAAARLHYVSTAFVARAENGRKDCGEGRADPTAYLASKRTAEDFVRHANVPGTIVRPSVVIGDTRTGRISAYQGVHALQWAVLRNSLPLLPLPTGSHVDVIAQDVLARAIASLVDHDAQGEFWITGGKHALSAERILELTVATGRRLGLDVIPPRLVEPDMVDRLVRPVFVAPLPPALRRRFDDMLLLTALFATPQVFPSDLHRIPGQQALAMEQLTDAYVRSVVYLVRAKGLDRSVAQGRAA